MFVLFESFTSLYEFSVFCKLSSVYWHREFCPVAFCALIYLTSCHKYPSCIDLHLSTSLIFICRLCQNKTNEPKKIEIIKSRSMKNIPKIVYIYSCNFWLLVVVCPCLAVCVHLEKLKLILILNFKLFV